jgi:hypothetical protein
VASRAGLLRAFRSRPPRAPSSTRDCSRRRNCRRALRTCGSPPSRRRSRCCREKSARPQRRCGRWRHRFTHWRTAAS